MKSWLPPIGARSLNPGPLPQAHECSLESPKRNRHPGPGRKEPGEISSRWPRMLTLLGVASESSSQACSDWNQARLEELRGPDWEHSALEVDITGAQSKGLAGPKSSSIEQ